MLKSKDESMLDIDGSVRQRKPMRKERKKSLSAYVSILFFIFILDFLLRFVQFREMLPFMVFYLGPNIFFFFLSTHRVCHPSLIIKKKF